MAIRRDPQNPLCKFHKASILFSSDRHHEALKELEELKELVPRESLVYFLMGKVNKKLGNTHLALMNFSWAMDLDPKGANNQIKVVHFTKIIFVHDGTNSVVDYNSLRVAVGCMDVCLSLSVRPEANFTMG